MSSILNGKRTALILLGLLCATGCQEFRPIPPTEAQSPPIKTDQAMAARHWTSTSALYQNDQVTAGARLWTLEPKADPLFVNAAITPGLFVVNIVLIPYAVFEEPAWKNVDYKAMVMLPTYSGNPPLPKSPVPPVK